MRTWCFALLGCLSCTEDALARARREGSLRVGYAVEAPYAFVDDDGRVTGADPELAALVVGRLGVGRVRWRLTRFADLLDELDAGLIDAVASGLFVTAERARRVRFSTPTLTVRESLLVRAGNPLALTGYPAVARHPTARVAVLGASTEQEALVRLGLPRERLVDVPDALAGRAAVINGQVDALALSEPTLRWASADPRVERVRDVEQPDDQPDLCAVAMRQRDEALQRAWDDALAELRPTAPYLAVLDRFGFAEAAR